MVDIGGTNGALVVAAPELLEGVELEIHAVGDPWRGTHTAVRRRELPGSVAFAGVFGTLPAGDYELRILAAPVDTASAGTEVPVRIVAGEVAHLQWPDPTGGHPAD